MTILSRASLSLAMQNLPKVIQPGGVMQEAKYEGRNWVWDIEG
jgi:hypothetical protein